jgi:hypothetical protein
MHRTDHFNLANGLVALVLALAAALSLPAVARAQMPAGYVPEVEQELALIGAENRVGVASPDGYQPQLHTGAAVAAAESVSSPDGYQPQLRGTESLVIREAPDGSQPQLRRSSAGDTVTVYTTDAGTPFESGDVALGFAAGLLLSLMAAIAITFTSRHQAGVAHS